MGNNTHYRSRTFAVRQGALGLTMKEKMCMQRRNKLAKDRYL